MVTMVKYLGRMVAKEGFRAFVHHVNGTHQIVGSWNDYQDKLGTGQWFDTKEEAYQAAHGDPAQILEPITERQADDVSNVSLLVDSDDKAADEKKEITNQEFKGKKFKRGV